MSKVLLYVYDLSQGMARGLSMQFLGIQLDIVPHTGIIVYGREYFFSGGVQQLPKDAFGRLRNLPPCEVIELGETEVPEDLFEEFLDDVRPRFTAATYNLLRHNCNHFTEEAAQFLLGKSIPEEIRRLPERVMATPMGQVFAQMFEGTANSFDPLQSGGETRGARLMALALLTNLASRPADALTILTMSAESSTDADGANTDAANAEGLDGSRSRAVGDAVVQAATAALLQTDGHGAPTTADTALCQMGAALAYNLSLHLPALEVEERRAALGCAMLTAAINSLGQMSDAEALGRTLSIVAHLLHPYEDSAVAEGYSQDEAMALALSMDVSDTLASVAATASALGHEALLEDVRRLVPS